MQELRAGQSGSESLIERSLGTLLSRLIKTGFYILTAIYSVKLIYQLFSRAAALDWLVGMLFSYVIWAVIMTVALVLLGLLIFFLVVGGSEFARRFVAGRAIGTLGILIAGLGLNHKKQVFVVGGDYQQRDRAYLNMATFVNGDWAAVDSGKRGLRTAIQCQGNICIASGKTGNDISFDAGKSWQTLDASNKQDITGFYTLAASDMVFLAAGTDGKIGVVSFKPE